MLIYIFLNTS